MCCARHCLLPCSNVSYYLIQCTHHGHEIKSQSIVMIGSDWTGRDKSNYQYIIADAEEPLC